MDARGACLHEKRTSHALFLIHCVAQEPAPEAPYIPQKYKSQTGMQASRLWLMFFRHAWLVLYA